MNEAFRFRPRVEQLEDRWVPAVITATPPAPAFPPASLLAPAVSTASTTSLVQVFGPSKADLLAAQNLALFQQIQQPTPIPLEQTAVYLNGGGSGGVRGNPEVNATVEVSFLPGETIF